MWCVFLVAIKGQVNLQNTTNPKGLRSPWALFLTKRVTEVSKSVLVIGQKNIFLANQPINYVSANQSANQLCVPFT